MSGLLSRGDVIGGKYRLQHVIGRGGMGIVLQAWHLDFDEPVAVKCLLPEVLSSEESVARFEREARANFKIKGEHVARVLDVGKTDAGLPYMAMEFLDGCDLADVLARERRVPFADAVDYILQACDAVAEAHAQGIVHRDLKPENLFITKRPDGSDCLKVLDFGLSKLSDGEVRGRALTGNFQLLGTPHYMSPEQWVSTSEVGPLSDLWALAVIVYELIAGVPPFRGEKLMDICNRILEGKPTPIGEYCDDVPPELEAAIFACLAKKPADRLKNVGDFAIKLHPFARREGRLAAKRASGVLRNAGIEVSGNVPSTVFVPAADSSGRDESTTDLMAVPSQAEQVRRAHAILALAERSRRGLGGADAGAANTEPAPNSDGEPSARVGATTLLLDADGDSLDELSRSSATGVAARLREDTPTTAFEGDARRQISHGPVNIERVAASRPPLPTTAPPLEDDRPKAGLPDSDATSPWIAAGLPARDSMENSAFGPLEDRADATSSGAPGRHQHVDLGSTVVARRSVTTWGLRKKRQRGWLLAVVVLGLLLGLLALALAIDVLGPRRRTEDSVAPVLHAPTNAPASVTTMDSQDPVPPIGAEPTRSSSPRPSRASSPEQGRAPNAPKFEPRVVGSAGTQSSASSGPDVDDRRRPSIPTTIE